MTEREQLEEAIATLEAQRDSLGDALVEAALGPLQRQLAELKLAEHKLALDLEGERKFGGNLARNIFSRRPFFSSK